MLDSHEADIIVSNVLITYPRSIKANIDETRVISALLSDRTGTEHVMLDVGAHRGRTAQSFADLGWRVFCFEPDAENLSHLEARLGASPQVTIDPRAVSDRPAKSMAFFRSAESSGISSLAAFHATHEAVSMVSVTNVAAIIEQFELARIDFLKIDAEGFDFMVLRGVPWNKLKPEVIEAEFEDRKTVPLGYDWRQVAEFLTAEGYAVYVSEWHPVLRYGINHDWHRLFRFPGSLSDEQSWGNLLAFHDDPGESVLAAKFRDFIVFHNSEKRDGALTRLRKTTHKCIVRLFYRGGRGIGKLGKRVMRVFRGGA